MESGSNGIKDCGRIKQKTLNNREGEKIIIFNVENPQLSLFRVKAPQLIIQ